ncbi:uncharacterized protein MONBRDRAFT_12118 [Monosiga brevicollis MX1]|uniref:Uncharacterized protein n=1 Tax=Monosiga brevicollis TaxID=81824 RepID=A9VB99_MONBE|nr:uncharacterized protein MONBRDRAFT_12118 [Monosiga brevicollis MX1]EDQ85200.1 predicted protein [Monosiga brevicollis MX1]|eukprot:XP_001750025.1 hypothetical protein [Monosiga brevicollis MX1]
MEAPSSPTTPTYGRSISRLGHLSRLMEHELQVETVRETLAKFDINSTPSSPSAASPGFPSTSPAGHRRRSSSRSRRSSSFSAPRTSAIASPGPFSPHNNKTESNASPNAGPHAHAAAVSPPGLTASPDTSLESFVSTSTSPSNGPASQDRPARPTAAHVTRRRNSISSSSPSASPSAHYGQFIREPRDLKTLPPLRLAPPEAPNHRPRPSAAQSPSALGLDVCRRRSSLTRNRSADDDDATTNGPLDPHTSPWRGYAARRDANLDMDDFLAKPSPPTPDQTRGPSSEARRRVNRRRSLSLTRHQPAALHEEATRRGSDDPALVRPHLDGVAPLPCRPAAVRRASVHVSLAHRAISDGYEAPRRRSDGAIHLRSDSESARPQAPSAVRGPAPHGRRVSSLSDGELGAKLRQLHDSWALPATTSRPDPADQTSHSPRRADSGIGRSDLNLLTAPRPSAGDNVVKRLADAAFSSSDDSDSELSDNEQIFHC